jgi:hypothetical protein
MVFMVSGFVSRSYKRAVYHMIRSTGGDEMGQTSSTAIQAAAMRWSLVNESSGLCVLATIAQGMGIDKYLFSIHTTSVPN